MVVQEQPKSFKDKNHIEIFLISLFAKGQNTSPVYSEENIEPELKIPFTLSKQELKNYAIPDIRMAGFGPLFSGIFIISVIVGIIMVIKLVKNKKYDLLIPYLIVIGITAFLLIILDGNYWARYIPYVFAIPVISLIYLLYSIKEKQDENSKDLQSKKQIIYNKIKIGTGIIVLVLMFINVGLIFKVNIKSIKDNTIYIGNRLKEFKTYAKDKENVDIKLNHWGLQGVLYNLDDMNIHNYTVKDEITGTNEGYFFSY